MTRLIRKYVIGLVTLVSLIFLWQWLGSSSVPFKLLLSTPRDVVRYANEHLDPLMLDFGYTLGVSLAGFLMALVLAIGLAVASYSRKLLRSPTMRFLHVVQLVPLLVFAPFITMIFSVGPAAHIAMTFMVCLFPLYALVLEALLSLPQALTDLMTLYRLPSGIVMRRVYLPYILPQIFSAARVTSALAVTGAAVAEFMGGHYGLGKSVFEAAVRIDPEKMICATVGLVLIGAFYVFLLKGIQRRVIQWKP